ncbi:hypothetical protein LJ739_12215 [Aestuariibacter halophilus]|uniref:Uncharacterized protein n=1 Tax=Fluctibacter halophilus TaxID=226011 RepID=A0ABS8G925_9ALTE|nr:hypothetical protein [Aestuariibacter halophilus]MCC2617008.1 hypothetical protein [Aestuariibacter halophilus]
MSEKSPSTSKKTLIMVMVAFIVPVLVAKLALDNDWFNRGATNKGELLQPALDARGLFADQPPRWRIAYVMPQQCGNACDNALYSVHQVWLALGREMDRVEPVILATDSSDGTTAQHVSAFENMKLLTVSQQSVNQVFKDVAPDGIFLIDTLGNVIMHYPVFEQKEQAVLHSRDILSDLRKLLKLSRIG